jgi:uncharacterized protein (TIGR00730 family)
MDDRADAFVVLPGGFGTLEEVSEVVTHRYLRYHDKPIIIVNHRGFYDPLGELFEHFIDAGFAGPAYRKMFTIVGEVEDAVAELEAGAVTGGGRSASPLG